MTIWIKNSPTPTLEGTITPKLQKVAVKDDFYSVMKQSGFFYNNNLKTVRGGVY